jgi:uncharacterized protein YaaN involved in tellurite resistance
MTVELNPPDVLLAPEPVAPVEREQAEGMVKLDETALDRLDARAVEFVDGVMKQSLHTEAFNNMVTTIHNLGSKEIRESASVSNRMLDKPARSLSDGIFDEQSPISQTLVDLRRTVEDLDPAQQGDLLSPRKILGLIPYGNRLREYFMKFESSQEHINKIVNALYKSQDVLRKDNAAIEQEKANLWRIMQRMQEYIYVGRKIDVALEDRIDQLEFQNPEQARVVREEMLFYTRQKVQDLLTQLAVSIQGYLALDMVRKNNLELVKGVDRAATTTVSALRTAVIVAQALANQKLVLDQVNALQATTSNMIESTSAALKRQSGDIYKQATSATIDMEQLQRAFANIYEAMDMVADYKVEALDNMKQTVNVLSAEVEKANTYLDRVRTEEASRATADLDLLSASEQ